MCALFATLVHAIRAVLELFACWIGEHGHSCPELAVHIPWLQGVSNTPYLHIIYANLHYNE